MGLGYYYNNSSLKYEVPIDMNNNKITGVVNGTDPNDAINKSQLDIFETKLNILLTPDF